MLKPGSQRPASDGMGAVDAETSRLINRDGRRLAPPISSSAVVKMRYADQFFSYIRHLLSQKGENDMHVTGLVKLYFWKMWCRPMCVYLSILKCFANFSCF